MGSWKFACSQRSKAESIINAAIGTHAGRCGLFPRVDQCSSASQGACTDNWRFPGPACATPADPRGCTAGATGCPTGRAPGPAPGRTPPTCGGTSSGCRSAGGLHAVRAAEGMAVLARVPDQDAEYTFSGIALCNNSPHSASGQWKEHERRTPHRTIFPPFKTAEGLAALSGAGRPRRGWRGVSGRRCEHGRRQREPRLRTLHLARVQYHFTLGCRSTFWTMFVILDGAWCRASRLFGWYRVPKGS